MHLHQLEQRPPPALQLAHQRLVLRLRRARLVLRQQRQAHGGQPLQLPVGADDLCEGMGEGVGVREDCGGYTYGGVDNLRGVLPLHSPQPLGVIATPQLAHRMRAMTLPAHGRELLGPHTPTREDQSGHGRPYSTPLLPTCVRSSLTASLTYASVVSRSPSSTPSVPRSSSSTLGGMRAG